jgi:hypothetical protein
MCTGFDLRAASAHGSRPSGRWLDQFRVLVCTSPSTSRYLTGLRLRMSALQVCLPGRFPFVRDPCRGNRKTYSLFGGLLRSSSQGRIKSGPERHLDTLDGPRFWIQREMKHHSLFESTNSSSGTAPSRACRSAKRCSPVPDASGDPQSRPGHHQPPPRGGAPSCLRSGRLWAPQRRSCRLNTAGQGRQEAGRQAWKLVDRRSGASTLAGTQP